MLGDAQAGIFSPRFLDGRNQRPPLVELRLEDGDFAWRRNAFLKRFTRDKVVVLAFHLANE